MAGRAWTCLIAESTADRNSSASNRASIAIVRQRRLSCPNEQPAPHSIGFRRVLLIWALIACCTASRRESADPAASMPTTEPVSILRFGGRGDGTTENKPAFDAAFDYLKAHGGSALLSCPREPTAIRPRTNFVAVVYLYARGEQRHRLWGWSAERHRVSRCARAAHSLAGGVRSESVLQDRDLAAELHAALGIGRLQTVCLGDRPAGGAERSRRRRRLPSGRQGRTAQRQRVAADWLPADALGVQDGQCRGPERRCST